MGGLESKNLCVNIKLHQIALANKEQSQCCSWLCYQLQTELEPLLWTAVVLMEYIAHKLKLIKLGNFNQCK